MRAYQDLRQYLQHLDQHGQLLTLDEQVQPEPDISAAACAINRLGDSSPALLFSNIYGHHAAKVVMNVHGSWANHALMMGLPKETPLKEQFFEFARRYQNFPGEVAFHHSAPWQEVVIEQGINLYEIMPLFRLNQGDGGFYLDKACVISRDPSAWEDDGRQNVGIYRLQVKGKDRLGIQPVPAHDLAVHLARAEELEEDLPVAIALGNEPWISTTAGMPILYDQSEYEMASVLQGAPYPVVRLNSGLDVPRGAEYVLEGRILSRVREPEGPFGEFTGSYSGGRRMPVIVIDKISHRQDPVFEHLYLGKPWTEVDYMIGINTSVPIFVQLKRDFPDVVAVNALYTHGLVVIISTRRRYGGFAKAMGLRVLSTPHGMGYAKLVIVVDENVDPFNLNQVMWAVSTRFNPASDLIVLPNMAVLPLDPSSQPAGISHKCIIDATTPLAPETRGHFGQPVNDPQGTEEWVEKLRTQLGASHERH